MPAPSRFPLVGGGEHDWAYLLGRLGWLDHDRAIASAVRLAGGALYAYAIIAGWLYASRTAPPIARGVEAPDAV